MKSQIGVIGLGVMGKSLAKNLLSRDFLVSGFSRRYEVTKQVDSEVAKNFQACETLKDFIASLEMPRKIILMVPAGDAVDVLCEEIVGMLDKGDIIMDCGNSFYKDTIRRYKSLQDKGIHYFGVGVSGGEKGALLGPSIMPGGDATVYPMIAPFLEKIAAQKDGQACCAYMGPSGAGHYVKMVHNGIEYADMQLIAEVYLFFKYVMKLSNKEMAKIFEDWIDTEVGSYLIEITASILKEKDPKTPHDLVDMIVDKASQKGTGKWTLIEGAELAQDVSIIQVAVGNRIISNFTKERTAFTRHFKGTPKLNISVPTPSISEIKDAYYIGKLVSYAQGFSLMAEASKQFDWNLNLSSIASIFRAGCIIQAKLLETLKDLFEKEPHLNNFLLSDSILPLVSSNINSLRQMNLASTLEGIPNPALSSALVYLDQLKSVSLGANLIQAQRDFFGAHTFERIDQDGSVHHEWNNE
ncbi:MAG: NADP-dependent phosphogluconate dehydrogenase [Brevinema sp.]